MRVWLIIIGCLLPVLVSESISYYLISNSSSKLLIENYRELKTSEISSVYSPTFKAIFPKPERRIVAVKSEYVDRLWATRLPGFGFGVFGDGIDPTKSYRILVFGDSFARGVGSVDNLRFGWVENLEKAFRDVDTLNFANVASSPGEQLEGYLKLRQDIEHDAVILSVFLGNDFEDSAVRSRSKLEKFLDEKLNFDGEFDADGLIGKLLIHRIHDDGCERILDHSYWPYTFQFLGKVANRFPNAPEFLRRLFPSCPTTNWRATPETDNPVVMEALEYLRKSAGENSDASDLLRFVSAKSRIYMFDADKGMRFIIPASSFDKGYSRRLGFIVADSVNRFHSAAREMGKEFLLIIHPHKILIYGNHAKGHRVSDVGLFKRGIASIRKALGLPTGMGEKSITSDEMKDIDFMYTAKHFKRLLAPEIRVLDLTESIHQRADESAIPLYWRVDPHYTPYGYLFAFDQICRWIAGNGFFGGQRINCTFPDDVRLAAMRLSAHH